jgi:hypothetical protein
MIFGHASSIAESLEYRDRWPLFVSNTRRVLEENPAHVLHAVVPPGKGTYTQWEIELRGDVLVFTAYNHLFPDERKNYERRIIQNQDQLFYSIAFMQIEWQLIEKQSFDGERTWAIGATPYFD